MVVCIKLPSFRRDNLEDGQKFLYEVYRAMNNPSQSTEAPIITFLTLVRSFFCDGCAILAHDFRTGGKDHHSYFDIGEVIREELRRARQQGKDKEPILLCDQDRDRSYLALLASQESDAQSAVFLLAWRCGSLFYNNDIVNLEIALSLYHGKYSNSIFSEQPLHEGDAETDLEPAAFQNALACALELVLLFRSDGLLLWLNEKAMHDLNALDWRHHVNGWKWCARILHPDDISTTLGRIESTMRLQSRSSSKARLSTRGEFQWFEWKVAPCCHRGNTARIWMLSCIQLRVEEHDRKTEALLMIESIRLIIPKIQTASRPAEQALNAQLAIQGLNKVSRMLLPEKKVAQSSNLNPGPKYAETCPEKVFEHAVKAVGSDLVASDQEILGLFDADVPSIVATDKGRLEKILIHYLQGLMEAKLKVDACTLVQVKVETTQTGRRVVFSGSVNAESAEKSFNFLIAEFIGGELRINSRDSRVELWVPDHGFKRQESVELDYITSPELLLALQNYVRFKSSMEPIVLYCCLKSTSLRSFVTSTFQRVQGMQINCNSILDAKLHENTINILIVDSLLGPVSEWSRTVESSLLASARFILLKDRKIDYYTQKLLCISVERPLVATQIIKAVHEAVIRSTLEQLSCLKCEMLEDEPDSSTTDTPLNLAQLYPLRIMVVEDSILNMKLLVKTLEKIGYTEIITAKDGKEAVDLYTQRIAEDRPIEIIFMDKQMPILDGCGASQQIREMRSTTRQGRIVGPHIIALTANSFSEDRRECLRSGMCKFAGKPLQWELLQQLIKEGYACLHGKLVCRCSAQRTLDW